MVAYGPANDPLGSYGIGIILAESHIEAEAIRDGDPAVQSSHGFRTEIAPMLRLVTPNQTYDAVSE